jgi:hypothetical protein
MSRFTTLIVTVVTSVSALALSPLVADINPFDLRPAVAEAAPKGSPSARTGNWCC